MRTATLSAILFAGFLCLLHLSGKAQEAPADTIAFVDHDFMAFRAEAARQGKPYMVYFSREKCLPCERLHQETFTHAELVRLTNTHLLSYHAHMSDLEALEIATSFEVSVAPTIIFFRPNGEIIGKLFGFQAAEKLVWLIERHMVPAPAVAGQGG